MSPRRKILVALAAGLALLLALGAVWAWISPGSQTDPLAEPPAPAPQSSAEPAAPSPEKVVRVECRQGACFWMRIVGIRTIATGADGELRRLDFRSGSGFDDPAVPAGERDVEWESRIRSSFAYCSRTRPTYAFPSSDEEGNGLVAHHLDLFDLSGYQYASARLYGLICHDLAIESGAEADWRSLGYRPGTRSEQERIDSPEDLLPVRR